MSLIINPYRYVSSGFSPSDIAGLKAWYDASDTDTITSSAGDVSQLDDKSGNAYHMTQGTAANQPRTGDTTINALNVLTIDASNAEHLRNNAFENLSGKRFTLFCVMYINSAAAESFGRIFVADEAETTSPANTIEMGAYKGGNPINRIITSVTITKNLTAPTDQAHIRSWYTSGTSFHVRVDGAASTGSPFSAGDGLLGSSTAFAIIGGLLDQATSGNFGGEFCELILYEGYIGDTDRDQVETYLADKWGVTI